MKTKLTKKQRIEAYKFMLRKIEMNRCRGFCNAFEQFKIENGLTVNSRQCFKFEKCLPELMKHKPGNNIYIYWFTVGEQGKYIRIKILKTIIKEMTENKLLRYIKVSGFK